MQYYTCNSNYLLPKVFTESHVRVKEISDVRRLCLGVSQQTTLQQVAARNVGYIPQTSEGRTT